MRHKIRLNLSIVFYQEDGRWFAHCLETSIVGDGATREEAFEQMSAAMACQVVASIDNGNPDNIFMPAEPHLFAMFAKGEDVLTGRINLNVDELPPDTIEDEAEFEGRQFIVDNVDGRMTACC